MDGYLKAARNWGWLSDPRAEISRRFVIVHRSGNTSRGAATGPEFSFVFLFAFTMRMREFTVALLRTIWKTQ